MKKILVSLSITAGMAVMFFLSGCTPDKPEKNPDPVDVCPNLPGVQTNPADCPNIPAPTGTAVANKNSVNYKETVTFTYSFQNTESVSVNGIILVGTSGTYTTGVLTKDSSFVFTGSAKGVNVSLLPIQISVGQDSRINFLTTGTFKDKGLITRQVGSTNWITYTKAFGGIVDDFVFSYQGYSGLPGNICNANGGTSTSRWFFQNEGFYFAGTNYDDFVITADNAFKIHKIEMSAGLQFESWVFLEK